MKQRFAALFKSAWQLPWFLRVSIVSCTFVLMLAFWPGMPGRVLLSFPQVIVVLPFTLIWFAWVGIRTLRDVFDLLWGDYEARRRSGFTSVLVIAFALGLLKFHVPQRIGFLSAFWAFLPYTQMQSPSYSAEANRGKSLLMGVYLVDQIQQMPSGSLFFRTCKYHTFDMIEAGFAYLPSGPIPSAGGRQYSYGHLFGNWYAYEIYDRF